MTTPQPTARFSRKPHYPILLHELRRHWAGLVQSERKHQLKAAHYLLYLALLGRDWRTAFTPVTRPNLLKNGRQPYDRVARALGVLHSKYQEPSVLEPFDGLISPQMLHALRARLPQASEVWEALPAEPYLEQEAHDEAA